MSGRNTTGIARRARGAGPALALLLAACGSGWTHEDGVASRTIWAKARGIDGFELQVFAPSDGQGAADGLRTGIVFAPGGFVAADRYAWFGRALAARGYVVAIPSFALELGFFTADNAAVARRVLVEGDPASNVGPLASRVIVAGHSLGGVVASGAAVDGGFDALVLLASVAAGYDDVESLEIPVLSLAGALDCSIPPKDVRAGAKRFRSIEYMELEGLGHYGFTDALDEDLDRGCAPAVGLEKGHALVAELVDTFVRARVDGEAGARDRLERGWPGVVATEAP